ncbi:prostatic spermine-binding protein [Phascolarctos cinereus]|uniref:Zymogen granule protein 16 homolog B n=1 Tax=Phascolarctos cinereus TaxID=38626 RepID=A0A6P5KZ33_PHACI|nr:zymogen granule protein 16 homolog B [Phascolarctos cinereus]
MQSFLVLVLLGGILCSFHGVLSEEFSGLGTGFFSITKDKPEDTVRALRFFFGPLGFLKAVQVKINDQWSSRHGVLGGRAQDIILWDGESITKVSGQGGLCIRYLEIETSTGRIFKLGKPVGKKFDDSPPYEDMELSGIKGVHGLICIKQLKCDWSYIYEVPTTTEITSPTVDPLPEDTSAVTDEST